MCKSTDNQVAWLAWRLASGRQGVEGLIKAFQLLGPGHNSSNIQGFSCSAEARCTCSIGPNECRLSLRPAKFLPSARV